MMRTAVVVAALVLSAASAWAQTEMALRFYIVPKIGDGVIEPFRPKYLADLRVPRAAMDYGLENTMLVGAQVTAQQHTDLTANLDVIAIPANLDATVGLTALSTVQDRLEGLYLPSDWVTTSTTYRQVIGAVGRLFLYMQRFHARQVRRFFESGLTLDTRVNQLTQAQRSAMEDAATSLGLDVSMITGPMPLRQALRLILQQVPAFTLMGETF